MLPNTSEVNAQAQDSTQCCDKMFFCGETRRRRMWKPPSKVTASL